MSKTDLSKQISEAVKAVEANLADELTTLTYARGEGIEKARQNVVTKIALMMLGLTDFPDKAMTTKEAVK